MDAAALLTLWGIMMHRAAMPITTHAMAFSKALVLGEAVPNDARKHNGCHVERALGDCVAPVLGVGKCISRKEQREHDVVDKNGDARQDVDGHDGCKCVAQAPQMDLVAYLCGHFRKAVEK
jgi:hypothetical protein